MKLPSGGYLVIGAFVLTCAGSLVVGLQRRGSTNSATQAFIQDIDSAVGALTQLTSSPQPSASPIPFSELTIPALRSRTYTSSIEELTKVSETATYTSYKAKYLSDGLALYGQLTIPKETAALPKPAEGWPAIVLVHGYIPPTLYKTFSSYSAYTDAVARRGFVVFKIDLRGHDTSEGTAMGAYYSADYVIDTLMAYNALQQETYVNPAKVALFGHSMAGNVTMRAAVVHKNIPAVVIWAGAVYTYQDMREYGIDDNSYRPPTTNTERQRLRELLRATHGEFDASKPFWQQVAPTNYLDDVQTAFQFHHPVNDTVVSVEYSRNVLPLLQTAGIPAEVHEYPTGGHNLTGGTFTQAVNKTVQFLNDTL